MSLLCPKLLLREIISFGIIWPHKKDNNRYDPLLSYQISGFGSRVHHNCQFYEAINSKTLAVCNIADIQTSTHQFSRPQDYWGEKKVDCLPAPGAQSLHRVREHTTLNCQKPLKSCQITFRWPFVQKGCSLSEIF